MAIWWGFWVFEWVWPFVLLSSSFPLLVSFYFPFWVPSFVRSLVVTSRLVSVAVCCPLFRWSRCCWPRGADLVFVVRFFDRVGFADPEARFWSLFGWPLFGRAGPVGSKVQNSFLQCASSGRVDVVDSEAPMLWCVLHGEADFVGLETRFWSFWMTSLGKAGLVGFEVLICFLQWAAFWHLDSGLVKVCFRLLYWHFFFFSLPLHHFHILGLVSLPWRVGLIAAAATSSRSNGPWPGPNTDWLSLTSLVIFSLVIINRSSQGDNAIWNEGVGGTEFVLWERGENLWRFPWCA